MDYKWLSRNLASITAWEMWEAYIIDCLEGGMHFKEVCLALEEAIMDATDYIYSLDDRDTGKKLLIYNDMYTAVKSGIGEFCRRYEERLIDGINYTFSKMQGLA